MTDYTLVAGRPSTALGTAQQDSNLADVGLRVNGYGEAAIRETAPTLYGLCEEGSLFVATNPTISTGVTFVAAQTAYGATAPNFHIVNTEQAGGKSIQLRSLKMIATAAATAATAIHYAVIIDPTQRAIATDHTAAITPKCLNSAKTASSTVRIYAQNSATVSVLAAASVGAYTAARGVLGGLNAVGDVLAILFGGITSDSSTGAAVVTGQPGVRVSNAPAISIGPGNSATVMIWMPASSASFDPEFELVFSLK